MNIGIIGAGKIVSDWHLPILKSLESLDRAKVCGIFSLSGKSAELLSVRNKIPTVYETVDEAIRSKETNVLLIAVPIFAVVELLADAAGSGKRVFCEKPALALPSEAACFENLRPPERNRVFIAENQLFFSYFNEIRQMLFSGRFGNLLAFRYSIKRFYGEENQDFLKVDWRKDPKHLGGYLYDYGVHHFSVLYRFLDGVDFIEGTMGKVGSYDRFPACLQWKLKKGAAEGLFEVDYRSSENSLEFFLLTDRGRLEISRSFVRFVPQEGSGFEANFPDGELQCSFENEWEAFEDFFLGNSKNPHSLDEAVQESLTFFECYKNSEFSL